jgi:hypothetical protein
MAEVYDSPTLLILTDLRCSASVMSADALSEVVLPDRILGSEVAQSQIGLMSAMGRMNQGALLYGTQFSKGNHSESNMTFFLDPLYEVYNGVLFVIY